MRTIFILIKKEFLQVFRSPLLLSILIVAPLAQFILFPFTADYEIKVLEIAFIDRDHSTTSRNIINDFAASKHFVSHGLIDSKVQADYMMKKDEIDFIVELPAGLEKSIMSQEQCNIAVTANAINWIPNLIINIYTFVITFAVLFRMDAVMAWMSLDSP